MPSLETAAAVDDGHPVADVIERALVEHLPWRPLSWHVTLRGNVAYLSHGIADDDGPVWAGEVELWRGAPSFDSHPEIEHALRAIMSPIHRDEFVRHTWVYDIPDHWGGAVNAGPNHRRYLLLTASGGLINWSLTLRLPVGAPKFVWKAIAYGFKATLKGDTMPHPTGPDQTAKPASLAKGEVPKPEAPPPPTREGINSLYGPAKG